MNLKASHLCYPIFGACLILGYSSSINFAFFGVFVLAFAFLILRKKISRTFISTPKIFLLILGFFFFLWFKDVSLLGEYQIHLLKELIFGTLIYLFVMLIWGLPGFDSKRLISTLFWLILFYSILGLLRALYIYFELGFLDQFVKDWLNFFSLRQDYNYHALLCLTGIVLLWLTSVPTFVKWLSFTILSMNIIFCNSRRGFIIYCFLLGLILLKNLPTRLEKKKWFLYPFFIACLFFIFNSFTKIVNDNIVFYHKPYKDNVYYGNVTPEFSYWKKQIESPDEKKELDPSTSKRLRRFYKTQEVIKHRDFFEIFSGKGLGYIKIFSDDEKTYDYPHNFLISAFLAGGVLFCLLHLWLVATTFKSLFLLRKYHFLKEDLIILICLAYLILSLTSYNTIFMNPFLVGAILITQIYASKLLKTKS